MDSAVMEVLKERLGNDQYAKLAKIDNPGMKRIRCQVC